MESPESVPSGGKTGSGKASSCILSGSPNSSRRLEGADLRQHGATIKRMKKLVESLPAEA